MTINEVLIKCLKSEQADKSTISPWLFNIFRDKCIRNAHVDVKSMLVREYECLCILYADIAILQAEN